MRGKKSNLTQSRKHNNSLSDLSNMRQVKALQNKQEISEKLAIERQQQPILPIPDWQDPKISRGFNDYLRIKAKLHPTDRYPGAQDDAKTKVVVNKFLGGYYQGENFAESEFKLAYRLYDALAYVQKYREENEPTSSLSPLPTVRNYRTYQNAGLYLVPKEFRDLMDHYHDFVKAGKANTLEARILKNNLEDRGFNRANSPFFAITDDL